MFDLSGKVVVVTGGGKGIGRGIVRCMARSGAAVAVVGRTPEPLQASAGDARQLGVEAITIPSDITKRVDLDMIVERTANELGPIDCWVNNAGSARPGQVGRLIELNEDQWDAVVDLNMKWTFFAAQTAARHMIANNKPGSIINISSRSGSQPCPMTGQYGAAKAGIDSLTATMAAEWGHHGIRVNGVAPGVVPVDDSGKTTMASESRRRRQIETVPLRRLGTPDDIGAACVYFASDESSWVSGEIMQITGGSRITVGYLTYMHHITQQLAEKNA